MATQSTPGKTIVRDDGCVCPEPEPELKPCKDKKPSTCPYDPRFPNASQTKHCYFSFIDFQRCSRLLGDYPGCKIFYTCYTDLCPIAWVEKWYDQMDEGTFPRKIYPSKPVVRPNPAKMNSICDEEEEIPEDIC